jgi:hypothetical protein
MVVLDEWVKRDGKSDPLALLDEALDSLAAGMRELQPEH